MLAFWGGGLLFLKYKCQPEKFSGHPWQRGQIAWGWRWWRERRLGCWRKLSQGVNIFYPTKKLLNRCLFGENRLKTCWGDWGDDKNWVKDTSPPEDCLAMSFVETPPSSSSFSSSSSSLYSSTYQVVLLLLLPLSGSSWWDLRVGWKMRSGNVWSFTLLSAGDLHCAPAQEQRVPCKAS